MQFLSECISSKDFSSFLFLDTQRDPRNRDFNLVLCCTQFLLLYVVIDPSEFFFSNTGPKWTDQKYLRRQIKVGIQFKRPLTPPSISPLSKCFLRRDSYSMRFYFSLSKYTKNVVFIFSFSKICAAAGLAFPWLGFFSQWSSFCSFQHFGTLCHLMSPFV